MDAILETFLSITPQWLFWFARIFVWKTQNPTTVSVEHQKFQILKLHDGWRICKGTWTQILQSIAVRCEALSQHIGVICLFSERYTAQIVNCQDIINCCCYESAVNGFISVRITALYLASKHPSMFSIKWYKRVVV